MVPLRFDKARIEALLAVASEQLDGEWLLIGGAAAAAWFSVARTTEDVDLVGLAGTAAERLALMDLASSAGLPIEAVNSAADFFVRKIDGWRDELVPLLRGQRATIYRPSATLFLLLKIERLTAVDLDDCSALLEHCTATGEHVDRERVRSRLASLPPAPDAGRQARRKSLEELLRVHVTASPGG
jgi:hypothetical protein